MEQFKAEVRQNFEHGFETLSNSINHTLDGLAGSKAKFESSYLRLVSLQAWRSELFSELLKEDEEAFFKEAHNDALMSHALARQGAWRVALMSLRSLIENTLFGLYYCEHPVELYQWGQGDHKLGFSETMLYMARHPRIIGLPVDVTGLDTLKSEYAMLSKAVHGSAKTFRMTRDGIITGLNVNSTADLGAWLTRERSTITGINLLLTCFFRSHIEGAARQNLRKAISLSIPVSKYVAVRAATKVALRR